MKHARGYHPPMWKMVLSAATATFVMLKIWDGIVVKIRGEINVLQMFQSCATLRYVVSIRTNIVVQSQGRNAKTYSAQQHAVAIQPVRYNRTITKQSLDFSSHLNIFLIM